MPPLAVAGLVAGGGALAYFGAKSEADAKQKAAEDQLNEQTSQQKRAMSFAAPTAQELQTLQSQLDNASKFQTYQEAALSNASALMGGQDAPTLSPLRNQITLQRQQLMSRLQQAYGPGWQNSSAGIEAMSRFDQSSQMSLSSAQQSYLSLVGGIAQGGAQTLEGLYGGAQGAMNTYQNRQLQALQQNSTVQYQGAKYVGQGMMGGFANQMGNQLMQAGVSAGTMGAFGGGGGFGGGGAGVTGSAMGASPEMMQSPGTNPMYPTYGTGPLG